MCCRVLIMSKITCKVVLQLVVARWLSGCIVKASKDWGEFVLLTEDKIHFMFSKESYKWLEEVLLFKAYLCLWKIEPIICCFGNDLLLLDTFNVGRDMIDNVVVILKVLINERDTWIVDYFDILRRWFMMIEKWVDHNC